MIEESKLLRNSARCRHCNTHLISYHQHDFKQCPCMDESDAILEKFRIDDSLDLPWDDPEFKKAYSQCHGILVDGGLTYERRGWYNKNDLEETSIYEGDNKETTE